MTSILNISHDLLNKHTILTGYIELAKLNNVHLPPDRLEPVVQRIGELIDEVCLWALEKEKSRVPQKLSLLKFSEMLEAHLDKMGGIFPELHVFLEAKHTDEHQFVIVSSELVYQILENILENSLNAGKQLVRVKLESSKSFLLMSVTDSTRKFPLKPRRSHFLPNGIGKEIISENVRKMQGKVVFTAINDETYSVNIYLPLSK